MTFRRLYSRLRERGALVVGYTLLVLAGIFVFHFPLPALERTVYSFLVYAWGVFCLAGGLLCIAGTLARRIDWEALGLPLAAAACLTWSAALFMQAVYAEQSSAVTAAVMAGAFAFVLAQRWGDMLMLLREDGGEMRGPR